MASSSDEFGEDYVNLKPDEGGFFDLFKFLFSSDIGESKLIDCPEGKQERNLKRRWLIFLSILVQKLLNLFKLPMSWFGLTLEMWLNLLVQNRGFIGVLLNIFKGKLVIPDRTSATYLSAIANMDVRVELDEKITPKDSRYFPAFSIMAAKLAYENEAYIKRTVTDYWKMEFLGFYNFWNEFQEEKKPETQAFMLRDKKDDSELIVVSFRGTEMFNADDWSTDFDISWYEIPGVGKCHGGFMKALGLQKNQGWPKEIDQSSNGPQFAYYTIREKLKELLKENDKARFIVTGHSLGGALAAVFPVILAYHEETELLHRLEGVYTFGQPRVGDNKLGEYMKEQMSKHKVKFFRYVYGYDMVPRLPYDDTTFMFKHFGTCVYYDRFYKGQIVIEEPDKNYFSLKWWVPMMVNASMELVRSFTIGKQGPHYGEGWFLRVFRLIGLGMPGIPAHMPQDYVNSTRLGSLESDAPFNLSTKLD